MAYDEFKSKVIFRTTCFFFFYYTEEHLSEQGSGGTIVTAYLQVSEPV